jgi:hypothetical protein
LRSVRAIDRRIASDIEEHTLAQVKRNTHVEIQTELSERAPYGRLFVIGAHKATRIVACDEGT